MTRKYHLDNARYIELNPFFRLLIFLAFEDIGSYHRLANEVGYSDSSTLKNAINGKGKNMNKEKFEKIITRISHEKSNIQDK